MKAISLWQPWATALALGSKRIETRSWSTSYRGPLAIHAAKRFNAGEFVEVGSLWYWCGALNRRMGEVQNWHAALPFGAIVATCELIACRPTETFSVGEIDVPRNWGGLANYTWTERLMGDFGIGRFGWVLENIVALPEPIPWKGSQGFFEWDGRSVPV